MFRLNVSDNSYQKVLDFNYINDGGYPGSIFLFNDLYLYGTCTNGGVNGLGTIFTYRLRATSQAINLQFTNIDTSRIDVSFTIGNGDHRAVFICQGNSGIPALSDGITYTADATFGQGSITGNGWYCVANGNLTGETVTVEGLAPNTTYRVMVVEYTGDTGTEQYLTSTATGNPANVTTSNYTQIQNLSDSNIKVFPVPATDKLYIKLPDDKPATVEIINLNGQLVRKKLVNSQSSINVSGLAAGIYTLKIIAEDSLVIKKIEIQ